MNVHVTKMPPTKIENAKVSIGCPPPREGWKSFQFNLQNFKDLPTTTEHYVETPLFSCNGREWSLDIYPGGDSIADEGYMSIYLFHQSGGSIKINYEVMIIDKFGEKKKGRKTTNSFDGMNDGYGRRNFILRSDILDESQNILDSNGTLSVGVSIKEDPWRLSGMGASCDQRSGAKLGQRRQPQCRKCRRPVVTIASPSSSQAAIESASRTLPPG